jgi:hypothetical protein
VDLCIPSFSIPPKRWSEGSQSCELVKYGHESHGTRNQESLCWRGPASFFWTALFIPFDLIERIEDCVEKL